VADIFGEDAPSMLENPRRLHVARRMSEEKEDESSSMRAHHGLDFLRVKETKGKLVKFIATGLWNWTNRPLWKSRTPPDECSGHLNRNLIGQSPMPKRKPRQ